MQMVVTTTEE